MSINGQKITNMSVKVDKQCNKEESKIKRDKKEIVE